MEWLAFIYGVVTAFVFEIILLFCAAAKRGKK